MSIRNERLVIPALAPLYRSTHEFAETLLRVVAGGFLVIHGAGKIVDPFGAVQMVEGLGFYPGVFWSPLLAATEQPARNMGDYAFAIGQGPHLSLEDLTPELRGQEPPSGYARLADAPPLNAHEIERALIVDALRASSGRRAEAAAALGMSRSTLWRKMREHGL